jgi:hypothetical protein
VVNAAEVQFAGDHEDDGSAGGESFPAAERLAVLTAGRVVPPYGSCKSVVLRCTRAGENLVYRRGGKECVGVEL